MMSKRAFIVLLMGCVVVIAAATQDHEPEAVAGLSREEALKLGERMYRLGIEPSGEPMRAVVQGDIEVDGTMLSCQSCHQRSGMGSIEGTVVTLPTTGTWLYKPLVGEEMSPQSEARVPKRLSPPPFREAYTDQTVARAIWRGIDPNGRELSWVMPRYKLSTENMDILVYYLKNLSTDWSPGVDDTTIRFATVISDDVDAGRRNAMLDTLRVHIRDHNSQSRHEERRARGGPFYKEEKYVPFRRYALDVWELAGPRETWGAQLEDAYRKAPVFAMLGGITGGEWAPIHEFAERHQIPCILPVTDLPVISDSDWYTLYFSKGFYQEGEAAARFLHRADDLARNVPVVQVYRGTVTGRAFARGFRETRATMSLAPPVDLELAADRAVDEAFWSALLERQAGAVLALWLSPADLAGVARLGEAPRPPMILLSASLLGDDLAAAVPEAIRDLAFITEPYSFPEDEQRSRLATTSWLKAKGLKVSHFDIQTKMYFLGWTLAGMVKTMRDDFYRDYFLEKADMMRDQYYSIAIYPRLSFGPGQRYASKGCYVTQLTGGPEPHLEKRSTWVIH